MRKFAQLCDFAAFLDQALRDCFVCGLANPQMQRGLLSEKDLRLDKDVTLAIAIEMAVLGPQEKSTKLQIEDEDIQYVSNRKQGVAKCDCCGKRGTHCTMLSFPQLSMSRVW